MKKTINRNDWSGENVSYDLRKNTIKVNDTILIMEIKTNKDGDKHAKILLKDWCGKGKHQQLCSAFFYRNMWYCQEMGVERESEYLDEAAVEMYCNLV